MKIFLRAVQYHIDMIFGSFMHRVIWRNRHLLKKNWATGYLGTLNDPHREQLANLVLCDDVESVCEFGCGSGANLFHLKQSNPRLRALGLDLNREAIRTARAFALSKGLTQLEFAVADINNLGDKFSPDGYDVVLIDAVLMFVAPSEIMGVIQRARSIAKKKIVLHEYHCEGAFDGRFEGGRWMYDYSAIASSIDADATVSLYPACLTGGLWDSHGAVIEIGLS